ncbi:efflux transporter outer membrane subunit [Pedobacter cryoconitis]|uniref:NodT family efflux transporter outer membrane factor (OMF) lipoprotein n=1 Tax=Pedobacter cryoconitis TaxID=188932 RepID=A0A7X0J228_9SPHI|nr:efflux transporter outer membrane subunit [Pedobacter cryoconitis]MBB6499660.1 NodT family efflux transporter outer membrane factor (OMF) lipoprotein [Pedobacter cryoconitis]
MKLHKYIYLGAITLALSACKTGKNYVRPQVQLPDQFNQQTSKNAGPGIANIAYKDFFKEPLLKQLIDSAVRHNFDLQFAVKNIESAKLSLKQANLGQLPDLNLQVNATSNRPSDNSINGMSTAMFAGSKHIEDYTTGLGLSWEADIWGKIRRQKEAALGTYLQTEAAARAVQTQVVANVAQGFFNLLMLDAQLEIARRNVLLNDSTLLVIRLQKEAGQVSLLAVQQAEAQRLQAALIVPQLEQSIAIQENALRTLAGALPSKIERTVKLNAFTVPEHLTTGIPSSILGIRPDVRAAEMAVMAANAKMGAAQANMYPALTITASGGINAFKASNWFSIPGSLFGTVAGGLTQPLFQRGQLKTQLELARIEKDKSVIEFKRSVLNAVTEVTDALVKLDKLKEQRELQQTRVQTLKMAIKNADMLFKNGMANYLEVITAQSNVLQSELNLMDLDRQQLSAMVDLYRSLGGGWN